MLVDIFSKVDEMKVAIEADQLGDLQVFEQFCIKYLGFKNVIKALFGEICNILNEQKKEYGQWVNVVKEVVEAKYNSLKQ